MVCLNTFSFLNPSCDCQSEGFLRPMIKENYGLGKPDNHRRTAGLRTTNYRVSLTENSTLLLPKVCITLRTTRGNMFFPYKPHLISSIIQENNHSNESKLTLDFALFFLPLFLNFYLGLCSREYTEIFRRKHYRFYVFILNFHEQNFQGLQHLQSVCLHC